MAFPRTTSQLQSLCKYFDLIVIEVYYSKVVTTEMKFEEIFKISTMAMRLNRCHPAINRDKLWLFQFILISTFNLLCLGLLINSIIFHDIQTERYAEASKNCTMVIVSVTISFKYIILVYHQDSINGLMRTIDEDYNSAENFPVTEKRIVTKYAEKGVKVCKIWLVLAMASSVIFSIKAFMLMGYLHSKGEFKLVPMFDLTYPAFIDRYKDFIPVYCVLFVICSLFACYASSMYQGFDPLVPIFLLHCCGQLEVTSQRIIKIFEGTDDTQAYEKLKTIVLKLQDVYRIVDCVKLNFTILYEFTMKTTTFLVPLSAFQIVECLRNRDTNLEFIPFFIACLVHFYVPCYYSDLLMESGDKLRQTIYSCGWEKRQYLRSRRMVLFMLMRSTRPLVINTIFFPVCLDTFAEMCRTSYAIFNIMNAAWT